MTGLVCQYTGCVGGDLTLALSWDGEAGRGVELVFIGLDVTLSLINRHCCPGARIVCGQEPWLLFPEFRSGKERGKKICLLLLFPHPPPPRKEGELHLTLSPGDPTEDGAGAGNGSSNRNDGCEVAVPKLVP